MRPSAKSLYALLAAAGLAAAAPSPSPGQRRLYVASPGIRNYVEWGGKGILVYDIDRGHAFVKRIASPFDDPGGKVENVKGVCASAATRRLYVTTLTRLACIDLVTERPLWVKALEGGCDRLTRECVLDHLRPQVAKWWLPDDVVFIEQVPKTSVGKFDKKALRERFRDHEMP